jgi:hypothetical protein
VVESRGFEAARVLSLVSFDRTPGGTGHIGSMP